VAFELASFVLGINILTIKLLTAENVQLVKLVQATHKLELSNNVNHPPQLGVCQEAEVQFIAVAICQTVGVPVITIPHTFVLSAAVQVVSSFVSIAVC
tara:strand:- start:76 stop:369 length:294 start_codon:yes stop_codon:yes gene_type:complete